MKDGAVVCNSGHFDVEIELPALKEEAKSVTAERSPAGGRIHAEATAIASASSAQGRLVNLATAEGHPPSVMDMSFATQALATEYCVKNKGKLQRAVYPVPVEVEEFVARHKLESMGIGIDELTAEQKRYMSGWEQGT